MTRQRASNHPTNSMKSTATSKRPNPLPSSIADMQSATNASIRLTIEVGADAKIYVNEKLTQSTGSTRLFVSRDLKPGKDYQFKVRAEVNGSDGKLISESQQVTMIAGENKTMRFSLPESQLKLAAATHHRSKNARFE